MNWRRRPAAIAVLLLVGSIMVASAGAAVVQVTSPFDSDLGIVYETKSGAIVKDDAGVGPSDGDLFPDDNTVQLHKMRAGSNESGRMDVAAVESSNYGEVDNITLNDSNALGLMETKSEYVGFQSSGGLDSVAVRDIDFSSEGDGTADIKVSGTGTIYIYNITTAGYQLVNLTSGSTLKSGAVENNTISFNVTGNGDYEYDLRTSAVPPYVVSASPINGAYDTDRSVTLETTVRDPTGGGDVMVQFLAKGVDANSFKVVGSTQTVSSGGTASVSYSAPPGQVRWKVNLTAVDDGARQNSSTFRFGTPGNVSVYNASVAKETITLPKLDQSAMLVIQSEDSDYRNSLTVSDGEFDLAGVPDERLRLRINSSNFANRTIVVDDPAQNITTHLAPFPNTGLPGDNRTFVQQYSLDDRTGEFSVAESRLVVQDHFNGEWHTITYRAFTAENIATPVVQDNETYRFKVINPNAEIRGLGVRESDDSYETTVLSLTVEGIEPDFGAIPDQGYEWNATLVQPDSGSPSFEFVYATGSGITASGFSLTVYERGNASNTLIDQEYGLVNNLTETLPMTQSQAQKTYVVNWTATLGGEAITGERIIGPNRANFSVSVDPFWLETLSTGLLIVVAGFFGGIRSKIGAVVVPVLAGMLWFFGWLPVYVGGGAIVFAIALGVFRRSGEVTPR